MCSPSIRRDKPKPELSDYVRDPLDDSLASVPTDLRPNDGLPNDNKCRQCGRSATYDELIQYNGNHRDCNRVFTIRRVDPNRPPVKIIYKKDILAGMPTL